MEDHCNSPKPWWRTVAKLLMRVHSACRFEPASLLPRMKVGVMVV
jgi:hypothetical protein